MKSSIRLLHYLQQIGLSLAFSVMVFISILMIFLKTWMPQTADEIPIITSNSASTLLAMITGAALICSALYVLRDSNPKRVFITASGVYLAISLTLLFLYSDHLRGDAVSVYEAGTALKSGDYSPFQPGGYMHEFPHQLGLMYYYLIGTSIFGGVRWIYYANILWGLLSNYAVWSITKTYKHSTRTAEIASIIFPALFLPHTLFNLYGYNHSPSLALCLLGLSYLQRYFKEENLKHLPLVFVTLTGSILIRQNFKIIILAVILVSLLFLLDSIKWSRIILLLTILTSFLLPSLVHKGTEEYLGFEIGKGIPAVTWIAFGLQDSRVDEIRFDNIYRGRLPGWFNRYSGLLWESANYDAEETRRIATEDVKHFANLRLSSPYYGAEFFVTKIASSWIEPTYQSVFFGALPAEDYFSSSFLKDLYGGGQSHRYLTLVLRSVVFTFFALAAISLGRLLMLRKLDFSAHSIISISVLGAFLFHLLWEIKGAYIYPYVYMLIPLSSIGLHVLSTTARTLRKHFSTYTGKSSS